MSAESPSASTPMVASGPASAGIQLHSHTEQPPPPARRKAAMAATSAAAENTMDRYAAGRPSLRNGPARARMTKAQAGSSRAISAAKAGSVMSAGSAPEDVQVIGDGRALRAKDEDDDGEPQ